jgi:hypothetical protein
MPDVSWTFDTVDYGTLTASGLLTESLPTFRVGSTEELTFLFSPTNANHRTAYTKLREYAHFASSDTVDTGTDIRGVPWYRERLHPNAPYQTGLVKLSPSAEIEGTDAYWCVIVGGEDATQYVGGGERLTLELFVLAEAEAYTTRDDVEADLKSEL